MEMKLHGELSTIYQLFFGTPLFKPKFLVVPTFGIDLIDSTKK